MFIQFQYLKFEWHVGRIYKIITSIAVWMHLHHAKLYTRDYFTQNDDQIPDGIDENDNNNNDDNDDRDNDRNDYNDDRDNDRNDYNDDRDNDRNDYNDDRDNDRNDYNDDRGNDVETGLKPVSTNANTITNSKKSKRYSISEIIRGFKTVTSRKINHFQNTQGTSFRQKIDHDHIITTKKKKRMIP